MRRVFRFFRAFRVFPSFWKLYAPNEVTHHDRRRYANAAIGA